MSDWLWKGEPFKDEQIGDAVGFLYILTDTTNGRLYVGKKLFWKPKKQVARVKDGPNAGKSIKFKTGARAGKSRTERINVPSDWREYYSSSPEIQRLAKDDPERFKREIIRLAYGKGELSYLEAKYQMDNNVLLDDRYYNEVIDVRINAVALKRLKNEYAAEHSLHS